MEEWIGGKPDKEEKKPNFYQRVSSLKQKELRHSMSFANVDMMKTLKSAQNCLIKIDTVESRSKIEMEKFNNSSVPGSLSKDKSLASFYFFVTTIGYIDSKIRDEKELIDFNSSFLRIDDACNDRRHYEEIEKSKERIARYLIDREEIIDDYRSILDKYDSGRELTDEVLDAPPTYLNLGKLYEDGKNRSYELDLKSHFVSAYNIGFVTKDYYGENTSYEQRINTYRKLNSDLHVYVASNKEQVQYIKSLNKK